MFVSTHLQFVFHEVLYILANAVEAVIGAIYLDKGYGPAKAFIKKFILKYLEENDI